MITGRIEIRCDSEGREVGRTGYDARDRVTYRSETLHRRLPEGREASTTTYGRDGTIREKSLLRLDPQERVIEAVWWAPDETVIDRQVYAYDDVAGTVTFTRTRKSGKVVERWTRETRE